MANHSSTKKAIRKTARKTTVNKTRLSRIRTFVKKALEAIKTNDTVNAANAFVKAQSELARGVNHAIIKKNTASRTTMKLAAKLKSINFDGKLPKSEAINKNIGKASAQKVSVKTEVKEKKTEAENDTTKVLDAAVKKSATSSSAASVKSTQKAELAKKDDK